MNGLTLIYHFKSPQSTDGDFKSASYKVICFFSDQGFLDKELLQELCKSVPLANFSDLTFLNLDDLKVFAQRVSQEVDSKDVRLISVLDYNIGLDAARDIDTYQNIFNKYGELILNEHHSKKKGLFGRFFN